MSARRELALLGHALRREVERRRRRGRRRDTGEEPTPAAATATGTPPGAAAPSRATISAAAAPKTPAAAAPAAAAVATPGPAVDPLAPMAKPGEPGAETPETIRARARACPDLATLRAAVARCTACPLHATRKQTVFADGDGSAGCMFVGEAPGAEEDARGVPFVGRAGQLLTDIIVKGMRLERAHASIVNVLKCRPPQNRDPAPAEKAMCTPWLDRQIELVAPRVLIPLGRHAAQHLLGNDLSMGALRGRIWTRGAAKVVPTYHPAYLLRSPEFKPDTWQDVQLAMRELGLPSPEGR